MKGFKWCYLLIIMVMLVFHSCRSTTSEPEENKITLLRLSYQKINNDSNYNALFTGKLLISADTIKLHVPDMILYGTGGKTIIRYTMPDTFVYAKKEYTRKVKLNPGHKKIYMLLQGLNYPDIYSDTLEIDIQ